ncbi:MAG: sec-independent translocase [Pseudomonadota bacterium]|jgi:sec-independent protein translocase protein TatB|nr:Sec-independent protein translocase subunit TatB [Betaproteobacteria bacterium]
MIDFGIDKIALIGAVALIVIGPEKLPKVARTLGHLVGKAQRYVADVRAEVNRSIELDEIKKMKSQVEAAAREVESTVNQEVSQASTAINSDWSAFDTPAPATDSGVFAPEPPTYKHPRKNWRLKRGAMPQWYKQRQGIRTRAQSGAARVARFRPPGLKSRS